VGDWYVKFSQQAAKEPLLEEAIQEMLVKRENNDPATRELWKKMRDWALDGMHETYERFGTHIDKAYYESDHYLKGKDVVEQ
jgi:arginyl-tRNA synthetase